MRICSSIYVFITIYRRYCNGTMGNEIFTYCMEIELKMPEIMMHVQPPVGTVSGCSNKWLSHPTQAPLSSG